MPALTAAAFDEEGFYKIGDALKFADAAEPAKGLLFDGRIAEDFKLATGTWVSVGPLRMAFITQCAPLVRDVVLAGPDRDELAALIIPDVEACRKRAPELPPQRTAWLAQNRPCWPPKRRWKRTKPCTRTRKSRRRSMA